MVTPVKIYTERHRRRLRLRWWHAGKRYTLCLGVDDDHIGRHYAEAKAVEIQRDILLGGFDPTLLRYKPRSGRNSVSLTVPVLFERFTAYIKKEKGITSRSLEKYDDLLAHLRRSLDVPAVSVGDTQARSFANGLSKKISAVTLRNYLFLMRSCWRWAKDKYEIKDGGNPWEPVVRRLRVPPSQKPEPFTGTEIAQILHAFKTGSYRHYYPFVAFRLGTGCRPGEAAALRWKHLSPDFAVAWIGESVTRDGERKTTKTGRAREVILPDSLRTVLAEHAAENPDRDPNELVFPSKKSRQPIGDHTFRKVWQAVLLSLKISYRRPYSIRHSAISHALASGADPMQVATQAGHDAKTLFTNYASAIGKHPVFRDFP